MWSKAFLFCLRGYMLMSDGSALRSGADLWRIELAGSGSDRLVAALLQHKAPPGVSCAESEQIEQLWALVRNTGACKVLARWWQAALNQLQLCLHVMCAAFHQQTQLSGRV